MRQSLHTDASFMVASGDNDNHTNKPSLIFAANVDADEINITSQLNPNHRVANYVGNVTSSTVESVRRLHHYHHPNNSLSISTTHPYPPISNAKSIQEPRPPSIVAKRNARERNRVHTVNQAFIILKYHLPSIRTHSKRVSKLKILRAAINYIYMMTDILDGTIDRQSTIVGSSRKKAPTTTPRVNTIKQVKSQPTTIEPTTTTTAITSSDYVYLSTAPVIYYDVAGSSSTISSMSNAYYQ